jgi:adenylylsulfate kinase-like enzyme
MITLLFGQPHSGKTTLAHSLQTKLFIEYGEHIPIIDGDEIRDIFKNKDFSREGRLRNLQRISDIATFLSHKYPHVIISAVYPYKEARDYLRELNDNIVFTVELEYFKERGRENYHVKDFESENDGVNYMKIDTDKLPLEVCTEKIFKIIQKLENLF